MALPGTASSQGGLPTGTLTRSYGGDFDADGMLDMLYLSKASGAATGEVGAFLAPGLYETYMPNVATAADVASLPLDVGHAILAAEASELRAYTWDGSWSSEAGPPWTGIEQLEVYDGGGDVAWVFGVRPDTLAQETYIACAEFDKTEPNPANAWTDLGEFPTGATSVTRIVAVDFNGVGIPEVAVMSSAALAVFNAPSGTTHQASGLTHFYLATPYVYENLARLEDPGANDRLALLFATAGGAQIIGIVDRNQGMTNFRQLSGGTVTTFISGHGDNDGISDLYYARPGSWEFYELEATGAGGPLHNPSVPPVYNPPNARTVGVDDPSFVGSNEGWPALIDIERDGDGDLLFATDDVIEIVRREEDDAAVGVPYLEAPSLVPNSHGAMAYVNDAQEITVLVTLPSNYDGDYLEVAGWQMELDGVHPDSQAFDTFREPLAGYGPGDTLSLTSTLYGGGAYTHAAAVGFAEPQMTLNHIIFLSVQFSDAPNQSAPSTTLYPGVLIAFQATGLNASSDPPTGPDYGEILLTLQALPGWAGATFEVAAQSLAEGFVDAGDGNCSDCVPSPGGVPPVRKD